MRRLFSPPLVALLAAGAALFGTGVLVGQRRVAGQKTLIHTIAFKQMDGTTPEQLKEAWAATLKMAGEVPGIRNVWMGRVTNQTMNEATHGIVLEFESADALAKYAPHPAHREWEKIYFKVRTPGSNTIDVLGE